MKKVFFSVVSLIILSGLFYVYTLFEQNQEINDTKFQEFFLTNLAVVRQMQIRLGQDEPLSREEKINFIIKKGVGEYSSFSNEKLEKLNNMVEGIIADNKITNKEFNEFMKIKQE